MTVGDRVRLIYMPHIQMRSWVNSMSGWIKCYAGKPVNKPHHVSDWIVLLLRMTQLEGKKPRNFPWPPPSALFKDVLIAPTL